MSREEKKLAMAISTPSYMANNAKLAASLPTPPPFVPPEMEVNGESTRHGGVSYASNIKPSTGGTSMGGGGGGRGGGVGGGGGFDDARRRASFKAASDEAGISAVKAELAARQNSKMVEALMKKHAEAEQAIYEASMAPPPITLGDVISGTVGGGFELLTTAGTGIAAILPSGMIDGPMLAIKGVTGAVNAISDPYDLQNLYSLLPAAFERIKTLHLTSGSKLPVASLESTTAAAAEDYLNPLLGIASLLASFIDTLKSFEHNKIPAFLFTRLLCYTVLMFGDAGAGCITFLANVNRPWTDSRLVPFLKDMEETLQAGLRHLSKFAGPQWAFYLLAGSDLEFYLAEFRRNLMRSIEEFLLEIGMSISAYGQIGAMPNYTVVSGIKEYLDVARQDPRGGALDQLLIDCQASGTDISKFFPSSSSSSSTASASSPASAWGDAGGSAVLTFGAGGGFGGMSGGTSSSLVAPPATVNGLAMCVIDMEENFLQQCNASAGQIGTNGTGGVGGGGARQFFSATGAAAATSSFGIVSMQTLRPACICILWIEAFGAGVQKVTVETFVALIGSCLETRYGLEPAQVVPRLAGLRTGLYALATSATTTTFLSSSSSSSAATDTSAMRASIVNGGEVASSSPLDGSLDIQDIRRYFANIDPTERNLLQCIDRTLDLQKKNVKRLVPYHPLLQVGWGGGGTTNASSTSTSLGEDGLGYGDGYMGRLAASGLVWDHQQEGLFTAVFQEKKGWVTLTGARGSGKTVRALSLLWSLPVVPARDAVYVDLGGCTSEVDVMSACSSQLLLKCANGSKEAFQEQFTLFLASLNEASVVVFDNAHDGGIVSSSSSSSSGAKSVVDATSFALKGISSHVMSACHGFLSKLLFVIVSSNLTDKKLSFASELKVPPLSRGKAMMLATMLLPCDPACLVAAGLSQPGLMTRLARSCNLSVLRKVKELRDLDPSPMGYESALRLAAAGMGAELNSDETRVACCLLQGIAPFSPGLAWALCSQHFNGDVVRWGVAMIGLVQNGWLEYSPRLGYHLHSTHKAELPAPPSSSLSSPSSPSSPSSHAHVILSNDGLSLASQCDKYLFYYANELVRINTCCIETPTCLMSFDSQRRHFRNLFAQFYAAQQGGKKKNSGVVTVARLACSSPTVLVALARIVAGNMDKVLTLRFTLAGAVSLSKAVFDVLLATDDVKAVVKTGGGVEGVRACKDYASQLLRGGRGSEGLAALNKAIQQANNLGQYGPSITQLPSSPTPRFVSPPPPSSSSSSSSSSSTSSSSSSSSSTSTSTPKVQQLTHADRARVSAIIGLIHSTNTFNTKNNNNNNNAAAAKSNSDLAKAQAAFVESLRFWDEDFKSDFPFALNEHEVRHVETMRDTVRLEIEKRQRGVAQGCACVVA